MAEVTRYSMDFPGAAPPSFRERLLRAVEPLRARLRHWRALSAVGKNLRLHGSGWDQPYSLAVLLDAAEVLDLRKIHELGFRALMRTYADEAGYHHRDSEAIDLLAMTAQRIGNWGEAIRLMEHGGALRALGPSVAEGGVGLVEAISRRERTNLHVLGLGPPIRTTLLLDTMHGSVARLRPLPGPVADWLFVLCLVALDSLLQPSLARFRSPNDNGPTSNLLLRWHRRRRRRALPPPPGEIWLWLEMDPRVGIVFRATSSAMCVENSIDTLPGREDDTNPLNRRIWLNTAGLVTLLLRFYRDARLAEAEALRAPVTLLPVAGAILDDALGRLGAGRSPSMLAIRAPGALGAVPWAAAWTGEGYLVERVATTIDDGFPTGTASPRAPHLTALAGSSEAMAEEAAMVVARARGWGFPAAPPQPLTAASLREALARSTLVHIAAHVQGHPHDPARGRIQMADGAWIDVADVIGDHRGVELLFLAGCESGVATDAIEANGDDGTAPWRRAGIASVISTLWRISDSHAPRLADGFYARLLAGESRAGSLAGSQREMLRGNGATLATGDRFIEPADPEPPATIDPRHPRFWAGFRLTGAGGPISMPASGLSLP
ncbi:MAG: CHAT domain-containing protein [Sphingomonas sp.]